MALDVSPEATEAATDAYYRAADEPELGILAALRAAAPLIVAAELERIGYEIDRARGGLADDFDRGWSRALDYAVGELYERVGELRAEGDQPGATTRESEKD
jgi:hypothetical protein